MTPAKIHLLTATPMGILIVYRDRLWEFRVLAGSGWGRDGKENAIIYTSPLCYSQGQLASKLNIQLRRLGRKIGVNQTD